MEGMKRTRYELPECIAPPEGQMPDVFVMIRSSYHEHLKRFITLNKNRNVVHLFVKYVNVKINKVLFQTFSF